MRDIATRRSVLGLPPKAVRLRKHSLLWSELYRNEERLLRTAIGLNLIDIQHVGSTAIPGIKAKPIIDILAGVPSLELCQTLVEPLGRIEYVSLGNDLVPGHHVFGKGANRSYLLHVVEYQSAAWTRVVRFRDILLCNPDIASLYEAIKLRLGRQFRNDRTAYGEAKTPFIDAILQKGDDHGM